MKIATLPPWARELLEGERVARLGLLDSGGDPRVLPVTFALADAAVWSAIDRKPKRSAEPARVRWLRARPRAALTVDHYEDDWERLAWVQLLGRVSVVARADGRVGMEALAARYEPYRADPPPGPLLRLEVERALAWRADESSP